MIDIFDFFSFLKNPGLVRQSEIPSLYSFFNLVWKSFLVLIGFSVLSEFVISAPLKYFNLLPHPKVIEFSLLNVLILSLLSPIIEELVFRLPLRISRFNIAISLSLILFFSIFKLNIYVATFSSIVLFGVIYLRIKEGSDIKARITTYFTSNFFLIFYIQALLFGFIHLGNYDLNLSLSILFPIVVIRQIFTGCFFGYIRVKYTFGIYICIVTHIVVNSIFFLTIIK